MTRITNDIREKINRKAVTAAFAERETELAEVAHALGMEAYEASFPKAVRQQVESLPDGWLRKDKCLRFKANGEQVTLRVEDEVPVPSSRFNCQTIAELTGDLGTRVMAYGRASDGLRDAKWQAEREMNCFLERFRTFKQMREAWPEGEPFYGAFDVDKPAGGVPAVRVAEINKLLNIVEAA